MSRRGVRLFVSVALGLSLGWSCGGGRGGGGSGCGGGITCDNCGPGENLYVCALYPENNRICALDDFTADQHCAAIDSVVAGKTACGGSGPISHGTDSSPPPPGGAAGDSSGTGHHGAGADETKGGATR